MPCGAPVVHPPPDLAARAVHALDERLRFLGVGRALAGVVRVDEEAVLPLADAVLREQSVHPIGVGEVALVDERLRADAEGLELIGRQRDGARLDRLPVERLLQVVERARSLLLEGRGLVDRHELVLDASSEDRGGKGDHRESGHSVHGVSLVPGPSSTGESIWSRIFPIGRLRSDRLKR